MEISYPLIVTWIKWNAIMQLNGFWSCVEKNAIYETRYCNNKSSEKCTYSNDLFLENPINHLKNVLTVIIYV